MKLKQVHKNVFVLTGIQIEHLIGIVRNKNTKQRDFRETIGKLSVLLAGFASENFEVSEKQIETPICDCNVKMIKNQITIVPVLRAGLTMSQKLQDWFEDVTVGYLGIYRNPDTLKAVEYYEKMPANTENNHIVLCDPLIATCNSVTAAIEIIKKHKHKNITVLGIIASELAIKLFSEKYPDINIYVTAIDNKMNDHGYIIPGAGDAGDRSFTLR